MTETTAAVSEAFCAASDTHVLSWPSRSPFSSRHWKRPTAAGLLNPEPCAAAANIDTASYIPAAKPSLNGSPLVRKSATCSKKDRGAHAAPAMGGGATGRGGTGGVGAAGAGAGRGGAPPPAATCAHSSHAIFGASLK